jgi:hypothetical protein
LLEDTIRDYGIQEADIYNMDEKGFMMGVSGRAKVVIKATERNKFVTTDGNREWVSVIESVRSTGDLLPSMIIFKGKVHMEKWFKDKSIIRDSHIATSPNGWTDNELGCLWLVQLFEPVTRNSVGANRLLVLDGHESHISWAFIRHCWDHNIVPLCFPAHSTHLLQPLDIGLFSPLAKAYGKVVDNIVRFSHQRITKLEFLRAYFEAHDTAFTTKNIKSAFLTAGIQPLNRSVVLDKLPATEDDLELPNSPEAQLFQQMHDQNPTTPQNPRQMAEHSGWISNRLQRASVFESPTRKRLFQMEKAYLSSQSKLAITEVTLAQVRKQTEKQSTEHASRKRIRTSARVVTMEEVEERRKEEEEAKNKSVKAGRSSKAIIDPKLLQIGSKDEKLLGNTGAITTTLRMEDMMGVFNI